MSLEPGHTTITTNGVTLHAVHSGPEGGPLAILLHGFPEFWYGWRHQIGPLAGAGHRVLAPDQRGYNTSDKPVRVADYALDLLAADVIGLIDAAGAGRARAALIGHDWGGIVAWWAALRYPERIERLAVLNAPHPVAFRRY
jgi:pimeloyl-ACP methyl ester carboxylesterase